MPSTVQSEGRVIFTATNDQDHDTETWNLECMYACMYLFFHEIIKVFSLMFFWNCIDESKDCGWT